jgi:hypothetical protein
MEPKLVELDSRRRASLASIAHPGHSRYLTHAEINGTIIMTPVDLAPPVVGERPATLAPAEFADHVVDTTGAMLARLRENAQGAAGVHEPTAEERQPRPPQADGDW